MTPLQQKLEQLNLTTMSQHLDQMLAEATAKNLSLTQTLEALIDRELENRYQRSIERRFKLSRLQTKPSIDSFHFNHHKSRSQLKTRILRLLDLDFLRQGTSVCIIGNPGVGKTYLAKIIGWRACQANQRVQFTTAMDMLNHLLASQVDHSLVRKLKLYTEPTLLLVDELGYLSLDQQTSNLFYQVISTRHGHKRSTLITTNTTFSDWGNILYNTTIAWPSLIAWWKTPRSSSSEARAFAKVIRASRRANPRSAGSNQTPLCEDIPRGGVRRVTPQRRCRWEREFTTPALWFFGSSSLFRMFNFSANHLLLLSRMEYRSCIVFLMQDHSTRRVYRLYDFTKSQQITSGHFYCVWGKVNCADKLYLVIESVKSNQTRDGAGQKGKELGFMHGAIE
jgi:DNA replication protein DnaC